MPKIPGVNHLDAIKALQKVGFSIVRQGKHTVMSDGVRDGELPRDFDPQLIAFTDQHLYLVV